MGMQTLNFVGKNVGLVQTIRHCYDVMYAYDKPAFRHNYTFFILLCNVFVCNSICRLVNGSQQHSPVFNYKQSEGDFLLKFVTLPIIESSNCKLHDFPVRLFLADGGMKMNYGSRH